MPDTPSRRIRTTDTVFEIVSVLQDRGGATAAELAERLDLGESTVYEHLGSLTENGYVVNADGEYRRSLKFLEHGIDVRQSHPMYEFSQPTLDDLVERTEEIAWASTEEHGLSVTLDKRIAKNRVEELGGGIGDRSHLHTHAAGKAILAALPRERVNGIIDDRSLPEYADAITEPAELFEELGTIRDRGYALTDGEYATGIRGAGASVEFEGEVVGAVSVTGPANRIPDERLHGELPETVMGAADEIELKLTYTYEG